MSRSRRTRRAARYCTPTSPLATPGAPPPGAEQVPEVAEFDPGDVRWVGFWFRIGTQEAVGSIKPLWNSAYQLANAVGSPTLSFDGFSNEGNTDGMSLKGAEWSVNRDQYDLDGIDWTQWHFVEIGLERITKGVVSPGSWVKLYVDGVLKVDDSDWRADTGRAGLGGLVPTGSDRAYLKFGVYGGASVPYPRDHYYAGMKVGTTRAVVQ
jgi:hypothetical protein